MKDLKTQVEQCRNLLQNWDSYNADPINDATVDFALEMIPLLPPGDWWAGPSLSNSIYFECGERSIEVFDYTGWEEHERRFKKSYQRHPFSPSTEVYLFLRAWIQWFKRRKK